MLLPCTQEVKGLNPWQNTDYTRVFLYLLSVFQRLKQTHYRPWQALRFLEVEAPTFQDNRHMKVVRLSGLRTDLIYPKEIILVLIFVRDWVDPRVIVQPEGLCQWKIPMTTSGIEPATFRLEAQCLNQLLHRVPRIPTITGIKPELGPRMFPTALYPVHHAHSLSSCRSTPYSFRYRQRH